MARILCIETSTEVCSVAVAAEGKIIDMREDPVGQNHSKLLTVFIDDLLTANKLKASDLDAVAVSSGPGSYTGLRIGISAAKGICFGAELPLLEVSPLKAMASYVTANAEKYGLAPRQSDLFVPMIDARRMEVYMAAFNSNLDEVKKVEAHIIGADSFGDVDAGATIYIFGNGAEKCKSVLTDERFVFIDGVIASAQNMAAIATQAFEEKLFVDLAYFEPFYLKEFVATTPKNSVVLPQR